MNESTGTTSPLSAADWVTFALLCVLSLVVLLAPFVPFAVLIRTARQRPDLWHAYWQHPWLHGILLSLVLATTRIAFLFFFWLLAHVTSAAIYPFVYAAYPEMIALWYLDDRVPGWSLLPSAEQSQLRYYAAIFALNLAFWLGLMTLVTLAAQGKALWQRLFGTR